MDSEEFFNGLTPEPEAVPAVEPQATEPTPEPEPIAEPDPVVEPVEAKPEPGHIPITALLDEREKRKELERQIAALKAQAPTPEPINPNEDPASYVQQTVLDTKLNISEEMARDKYGDELTDAARDWAIARFGSNPAFQAEVLSNRHPWKYAVEAYQRDQIASQVTATDFEQFKAWKAAQAQIATQQPVMAAASPPPAAVPRSIASAPSAGGVAHEPIDPEAGYAAAIP